MRLHVVVQQLVPESLDFVRLLGIKAGSEAPRDASLASAGGRTGMLCQEQVLRLYLGKGCEHIAYHCEAKHSSTSPVPSRQLLFNTAQAHCYCAAAALSKIRGLDQV